MHLELDDSQDVAVAVIIGRVRISAFRSGLQYSCEAKSSYDSEEWRQPR
jgi:hypothetical protein